MARKLQRKKRGGGRRVYSDELKAEAVQMLLDGHRAQSVAEKFGLSGTHVLYRSNAKALQQGGPAAASLEGKQYVYVWADSVHFNIRLEEDHQCILVLMGPPRRARRS